MRVIDDQLEAQQAQASSTATLSHRGAIGEPTFNHWGVFHFCQRPTFHGLNLQNSRVFDNQQKKSSFPTACSTADFPQAAERPNNSTLNCGKLKSLDS